MTIENHVPGLNILIVEDNWDTAESMATILRIHGHQVQIARNGTDAVRQVEVDEPDVVLLDIGLPGMSGYAVASAIHDQMLRKTPLLIAVTGYGRDGDRQRCAAAGIDL